MKVAVVLYLYNTDLWDEYKILLENIPNSKIKLYIGLCKHTQYANIINDLYKSNLNYYLTFHSNFGGDIAPFLSQLKHIHEPYFIKIHGKKSLWKNRINWRKDLNNLLKTSIVEYTINTLASNNIGMIGHAKYLMYDRMCIHTQKIKELCNILTLNYSLLKNSAFFAGSMFISKTHIFQKAFLPYVDILLSLLSNEKLKINETCGTYSHALERIFGYLIKNNNQKISLYYT